MRCRLIVNPVAGHEQAGAHLEPILEQLRSVASELDVVVTEQDGDGARAAFDAAQLGFDHVFVAGGDGTLNEVLNGVGRAEAFGRVTLGLIPLGTGNDFAQALGLTKDVDRAVQVLLGSQSVVVDVGQMNDVFFVNVSAGGFIAEVSEAVDSKLKSITGRLAYLLGGAPVLLDYEPVPATIELIEPEAPLPRLTVQLQMFAVCNSRLVGGGHAIAPYAMIDDGRLDVCVVEGMAPLEFLRLLAQVPSGQHVSDPRVFYGRARGIDLSFGRPLKVNTDGEVLELSSCRYRVLPGAARFLCAPDAPFCSPRAPSAGEDERAPISR